MKLAEQVVHAEVSVTAGVVKVVVIIGDVWWRWCLAAVILREMRLALKL